MGESSGREKQTRMDGRRLRAVTAESAPAAIGPYSQAVRSGDWLFCSGQIPLDPATGNLVEGAFEVQAHRVFENLAALLAAADVGWKDAVKLTIYLTDLANFAALNDIYAGYFAEPYPARAAVEVAALPKGAMIEIDLIARKPG